MYYKIELVCIVISNIYYENRFNGDSQNVKNEIWNNMLSTKRSVPKVLINNYRLKSLIVYRIVLKIPWIIKIKWQTYFSDRQEMFGPLWPANECTNYELADTVPNGRYVYSPTAGSVHYLIPSSSVLLCMSTVGWGFRLRFCCRITKRTENRPK